MEIENMSICGKEAAEDEQKKRRKGKRKEVEPFVSLPDDIVAEILKRVADAFLVYKAKYVCRRWVDVISNNIVPDCASLILQWGNMAARHVGIKEERGKGLQVKVQYLDMSRKGIIRSWCNELLLTSHCEDRKRCMYVYNLITKKGSYLPKCNALCGGNCTHKCGVALSFDGVKGIYKVVHLFRGPPIECHILNLRSNWEKIQFPDCMNGDWLLSYHNPVSVQGRYLHWRVHRDNNKRLISMDMVKEEIVFLPLPCGLIFSEFTIFEMRGSLALLARVSGGKAEIWILKDFQRNNWEKLQSLTLKNSCCKRFPVYGVMIRSNKYIILRSKSIFDEGMWYYDLKNGVLKKLDIRIGYGTRCIVHSSPPSY